MKKILFLGAIGLLAVLGVACTGSSSSADESFVKVNPDGQFIRNGKPYYFVGANFWYGPILGSKGQGGDRKRLHKELDYLKSIGVTNLRVLVGALRAVDFICSLPQYNGQALGVAGSSQGGAQSLAVAGLSPEVTFCYAGVPGLCNHGGIEKKQARGWPGNFPWNEKTKRTAGYFDNCSFARRIRCPVFVTAAWHDFLTKPSTVYAAWNNITSPKELRPFPNAGHWPAIRDTEDYARNEIRKHLKGQSK